MSDIWERKEFSQFTTHAAPEVDCDEEEELVRGCGGRDASLEIKDIVLRFGKGDLRCYVIPPYLSFYELTYEQNQNNIRLCISKGLCPLIILT